MELEQQDGERVSGTFTLTAQMPQGKNLSIVGYILASDSKEKINEQLDQAHDLIDRQRTRSEIPELEVKLDRSFEALRNHKDHLEGLVKAREAIVQSKANGEKLSSTRKKQLDDSQVAIDNVRTTIVKIQEDIDKGLVAVESAKKKLE